MPTYLADTNLLLRLVDKASLLHPVASGAIEQIVREGSHLYICPQNLIEFWAVATRPVANRGMGLDKASALKRFEEFKIRFSFAQDRPEVFDNWEKLIRKLSIQGKRSHDARLAAVALAYNFDYLLTFNTDDFKNLSVSIVHPARLIRTSPSSSGLLES